MNSRAPLISLISSLLKNSLAFELFTPSTFSVSRRSSPGDKRIRTLKCWDQLIALLFCQLAGRQSLRDLVACFNSQKSHHYHLGTQVIRRSSLSDANRDRSAAIFQETFFYLLNQARSALAKKEAQDMVGRIDSTTIDLNLNQFKWARFRSTKAGIKRHTF